MFYFSSYEAGCNTIRGKNTAASIHRLKRIRTVFAEEAIPACDSSAGLLIPSN